MTGGIRLSQTAPWNPRLGNPYRTRWATAAGRYFKVYATSLDGLWLIEEVDADGNLIPVIEGGRVVEVAGLQDFAVTLADARRKIAEATR